MQKTNTEISFTLLLLSLLFVACSTPTVSSDDSDENSEKVEQEDRSSSSDMSNSKEADRSSSSEKKTESSSSENLSELDCSSAGKEDCLNFLKGVTGWSWNVSKEYRFNPDIEYGYMTDSRDGQVYRTVKVGEQTWMAENLNFDPGQGGSGNTKYEWSWCFDNDPKKCAVAGRLYTWAAAIDSVALATDEDNPMDCGFARACTIPSKLQGICPSGWHLPTDIEWRILFNEFGWGKEAENLKSQTGWEEGSFYGDDGGCGTDSVGFSVLPAGYRDDDSSFYDDGLEAHFWGAEEFSGGDACGMNIHYNHDTAYLYCDDKDYGFSIRCLKD